jgi:periplasmic divalent cation tolerance protein
MAEEVLIILTTWPDMEVARTATRAIIEQKLAACGNIVPAVESIYQWQGKVETSAEVLVIFKTTIARYQMLEARIKGLHPYEVPEIISVRITDGFPPYLRWVEQTCQ